MTVLDVGCGTGMVSAWIASKVGSAGRVVGVDVSNEQLEFARERATGLGLRNLDFLALSASDLREVGMQFDLVYSRFLLVHLEHPEDAVREMLGRVKRGGIWRATNRLWRAAAVFRIPQHFVRAWDLVIAQLSPET
jgi:ubiquinone/menaquinone biosynthesis C-methylase UbiE